MNNQIVVGTLMNLCDNPNTVSTGEEWGSNEKCRRTPIIVTGQSVSLGWWLVWLYDCCTLNASCSKQAGV